MSMKDFRALLNETLQSHQTALIESADAAADNNLYVFEDLADLSEAQLDEAAGALGGLPGHMTKTLAGSKWAGSPRAGENSPVDVHEAKSHSSMRSHIADALKAGKHAVIYKNGKPIASVTPHSPIGGGREEHTVLTPDHAKPESEIDHKPIRGNYRNGTHKVERNDLKRGEAIDRVGDVLKRNAAEGEDSTAKDHFKTHKIEVHAIAADPHRQALSTGREELKKHVPSREGYGSRGNPEQPGTLAHKTVTAARKVLDKHVGSTGNLDKAKEIHAKIGSAIESGDHAAVRKHVSELNDHMSKHGISNTPHSASTVDYHAKQLSTSTSGVGSRSKGSYNAKGFVDSIRRTGK